VKLGADEPIAAGSAAIAIAGKNAIKQASATLNLNAIARELSMMYLLADDFAIADLRLSAKVIRLFSGRPICRLPV
jgi:hypothetical protein